MSQKIAFITGGNRGLGFQTALDLKDPNTKVVIGSRDLEQGEKAVEKLRAAGVDADVLQFDITNPADYQAAYDYFNSKYGRLDILVNNAGIAGGTFPGTGPEHSAADVPARTARQGLRRPTSSPRSRSPRRSCLSSGRAPPAASSTCPAFSGRSPCTPIPNSPIYNAKSFAYDASKTALNAFTVHLAYELRDTNIKVNSAHPGWVKTDMGGEQAPMELSEGGKTSAALATLPDNGPSGGFFHLGKPLPW